jgi:hypothetical protein
MQDNGRLCIYAFYYFFVFCAVRVVSKEGEKLSELPIIVLVVTVASTDLSDWGNISEYCLVLEVE